MTRIEFAPEVADDLDRIFDHLAQYDVEHAAERIGDIVAAIDVLGPNPLIGRPAEMGRRELIIGKRGGAQGYVALYRYVAAIDTVLVLALRSQKEAGYRHD